jgi:hypothetical protein
MAGGESESDGSTTQAEGGSTTVPDPSEGDASSESDTTGETTDDGETTADSDGEAEFEPTSRDCADAQAGIGMDQVQAIFNLHCIECHSPPQNLRWRAPMKAWTARSGAPPIVPWRLG